MKLFVQTNSQMSSQIVGGVYEIDIPVNISFDLPGTGAVNIASFPVVITAPNLISALLFNISIATQVSNYVDANYGTSTSFTDVFLIGPNIAL
jgi:hypothetical protein